MTLETIKNKIKSVTIEDILCLFVILCPVLDMISFIFRNAVGTNFSPSTFLRPLIPILVIGYIFFKKGEKKQLIFGFFIYAVYGLVHLWLFQKIKTESSYGGLTNELQYIINYSFMILNLFLYTYIFRKGDSKKLKKVVLIALSIYIVSIFIAIITGTSSPTYIEGLGYKGWFESGNSLCAILCLSLCIVLPLIKEKEYRYWTLTIVLLTGIFLATLVGTRTGLIGFVLVVFFYITAELFTAIIRKIQVDIKTVVIGTLAIVMIIGLVFAFGSKTIERRSHLKEIENNIVDNETGEIAHISGDLLDLTKKIQKGEISDEYMSKPARQAILDLYSYAEKTNMVNNDMRKQQLVYNYYLVKNDHSISKVLFGNGYKAQFRELVMEMEIPSFLFNFGILGFMLYFGPFLSLFIYSCYFAIRNIKKIDASYILLLGGDVLGFALSFLSGYTFFNASSSLIIVIINVLLINRIKQIKEQE